MRELMPHDGLKVRWMKTCWDSRKGPEVLQREVIGRYPRQFRGGFGRRMTSQVPRHRKMTGVDLLHEQGGSALQYSRRGFPGPWAGIRGWDIPLQACYHVDRRVRMVQKDHFVLAKGLKGR